MRILYIILGWTFVVIGLVGVFLPILPTTPFMILALWCFSNSSPRFHHWLYTHKLFGPPLQQWEEYRVIPKTAKVIAVTFMAIGLAYLYSIPTAHLWIKISATSIILFGCWFILTKPSQKPIS